MHEHRRVEFLRGGEHLEQLRRVEVLAVDVTADLHAAHSQVAHAPLQLANGKVRRLHGQRPQPGKSSGMGANRLGDVIVENAGEVAPWLGCAQ